MPAEAEYDRRPPYLHAALLYETSLKNFVGFAKNSELVMPVPDQVRDDGSGIQNLLRLLESAKASLRARPSPE